MYEMTVVMEEPLSPYDLLLLSPVTVTTLRKHTVDCYCQTRG